MKEVFVLSQDVYCSSAALIITKDALCIKCLWAHQERDTNGLDGGKNHVDKVYFAYSLMTSGNSNGDVTVRDVMRVMTV